jgi:hypothetical protein
MPVPRVGDLANQRDAVVHAHNLSAALDRALVHAGGARGTERCGAVRTNAGGSDSEVVFRLRRPLSGFNKAVRLPALLVLLRSRPGGTPQEQLGRNASVLVKHLSRAGAWDVWAAAGAGSGRLGCVGRARA